METRRLTCIVCPMGCQMEVTLQDGVPVSVTGNTCPRGDRYAREECVNPTRVLTSTVRAEGGRLPVVPVKTAAPIPKALLLTCARELARHRPEAPIACGQVVIQDLCGTGVAVVATMDAPRDENSAPLPH